MKREYGPADFAKMISGLRQGAQQIYREEFEQFVNPAPVQLQFDFSTKGDSSGLDRDALEREK